MLHLRCSSTGCKTAATSSERRIRYNVCILPRIRRLCAPFATSNCQEVAQTHSLSLWSGSDEFTCHADRVDAPPLPLPSVTEPVRVVIVRHGQSTWNAEGRIQGSTDLSVLTAKGVKQAEKTRDMLSSMRFCTVFQSPLARARQTADVVMQGQPGRYLDGDEAGPYALERITLPSLREIDLYQFQGLLKHEGKALYGEQYKQWQKAPHAFELGGRVPVRELWHRASLAWQRLLTSGGPSQRQEEEPQQQGATGQGADPRVILVVAHNAINQALVATALGLPPSYFRRLPQNNAALSVIDFEPPLEPLAADGETGAPTAEGPAKAALVTLSCLNQSPDNPFKNPDKVVSNVVLLTPPVPKTLDAGAGSCEEQLLASLARVLSKLQVTHVLVGPSVPVSTVDALLAGQAALKRPPSPSPSLSLSLPNPAPTSKHSVVQAASSFAEEQHLLSADEGDGAESAAQEASKAGASGVSTGGRGGGIVVEGFVEAEAPGALWAAAVAAAAAEAAAAGPSDGGSSSSSSSSGGGGQQKYGNVLVVLDEHKHVEVLWAALGVDQHQRGLRVRVSPGGLSVVEFSADPRVTPATVRCINNTAHLAAR